MTPSAAPAGWPPQVRPPGAPDWERSAVNWLLDLCPADFRSVPLLRRYPVILARFAAMHVGAGVQATQTGLATARAELRGVVPPDAIEAAVATYEREAIRLAGAGRAVALVEAALRGQRFVPRL